MYGGSQKHGPVSHRFSTRHQKLGRSSGKYFSKLNGRWNYPKNVKDRVCENCFEFLFPCAVVSTAPPRVACTSGPDTRPQQHCWKAIPADTGLTCLIVDASTSDRKWPVAIDFTTHQKAGRPYGTSRITVTLHGFTAGLVRCSEAFNF